MASGPGPNLSLKLGHPADGPHTDLAIHLSFSKREAVPRSSQLYAAMNGRVAQIPIHHCSWGPHLQWLFSLLPVPGPPAEGRRQCLPFDPLRDNGECFAESISGHVLGNKLRPAR
jgi:hypothetical protein